MKKLIVGMLMALVITATGVARAQCPTCGKPADAPAVKMTCPCLMTQGLNLTDDQKPKVKAILEDQRKKIGDLRQDTSLTTEDRRAKMKAIHDNAVTQMKAVLTADQFQKWQGMQSQMRNRTSGNAPVNCGISGDIGRGVLEVRTRPWLN